MRWVGVASLVLVAGCGLGLDFDPPDPHFDASVRDFGGPVDGGTLDLSPRDANLMDLAVIDADVIDADVIDADLIDDGVGVGDATVGDAMPVVEAGMRDATVSFDAGTRDAGFDAGRDASSGCVDNSDCAPADFCARPDGACGSSAGLGVCMPRPGGCGGVIAPVCGCDDITYSSSCFAHSAGMNVNHVGSCGVPVCIPTGGLGCCCSRTDCTASDECVLTMGMGVPGVCHPPPPAGECWSDADCTVGSCHGASVCDCDVSCFVPDTTGSCG